MRSSTQDGLPRISCRPRKWLLVLLALIFLSPAGGSLVDDSRPWEYHLKDVVPSSSPEEQTKAVEGLLQRLLQERAKDFTLSVDPSLGPAGKDTFVVRSPGANTSVEVTGSSGVAAAWGILHYLKYYCKAHVSWEADQLNLPDVLPPATINITSNDKFRYYQNVCTVSYSMAWWGWQRWEREIDWMALNGINLPLAFTGQEAIWHRVYTKMGLTQAELDEHFAGPAFLAWGRMGNIRGWGGPLSAAWHNETVALQKLIVARMRQFGMIPILPAFAGHVPAGLARVHPEANITRLGPWSHFTDPYTRTFLLDPNDPLFQTIGSDFIQEVTSEFGSDHFYNCDTFNEMTPTSSDPEYLRSVGAAIYSAMAVADPNAIWVMQGWLFLNDGFWQLPQAEALLTSVPVGRMLVLDVASEVSPQYSRLQSYFGQPFIFCMLHNYGGVNGLFGNVDILLKNMEAARSFPNVSMVGTGLTPEGINQNYVMYDFMNELGWRSTSPNVSTWALDYASRRYGSDDPRLGQAWQLLMRSVYNNKIHTSNHGQYIVVIRPQIDVKPDTLWYSVSDVVAAWDRLIAVAKEEKQSLNLEPRRLYTAYKTTQNDPRIKTYDGVLNPHQNKQEVVHNSIRISRRSAVDVSEGAAVDVSEGAAVDVSEGAAVDVSEGVAVDVSEGAAVDEGGVNRKLVASEPEGTRGRMIDESEERRTRIKSVIEQSTFKHDLVDVTRQILQLVGGEMVIRLVQNYNNQVLLAVQESHSLLQQLLTELDLLLGSSPNFLLGSWVEAAAAWATNEKERDQYVFNALNQITLWGPTGEIHDYGIKQWSGLVANFIKPRWELFSETLEKSLKQGEPFDEALFNWDLFTSVEDPFTKDTNATFPSVPKGDSIEIAVELYNKYRPIFDSRLLRLFERRYQRSLRPFVKKTMIKTKINKDKIGKHLRGNSEIKNVGSNKILI
nr:alpha-N-acetylglucosaminidase-like [Procambarus clarkii]